MKTKITFQQITELKQKGLTQKEMSNIFQVTQQTIIRWKKPQSIPQKRGCKPKIRENTSELLNSYISVNNTATQQEMADYIYKETGQLVSQQTISRILKDHGITRKKTTYHYSEQMPNQENIKHFVEMVKLLLPNSILALDECGFHLNEAPRYGYSFKGIRADSRRPGKRGLNHTLILCIQNIEGKGVISYKLIEGGAKAIDFHNFLSSISFFPETKHYLLLDNACIHHASHACRKLGLTPIKELLRSKNIEPLYLPPYTPELNPTELCFNFLRQQIEKSRPRNLEQLKSHIDKSISVLHQKDLTKYFRHCFNV